MIWCERALLPSGVADGVLLDLEGDRIAAVTTGVPAPVDALRLPGVSLPGPVNAHSHAFHRVLRGRTHGGGGTFWTWREHMYAAAGELTPDRYRVLARAVFAEMAASGWTAVGDFHYVHHAAPGQEAQEPHAMELALAEAAAETGIRLTLLDTCYLASGIDASGTPIPPLPEQQRFCDGDIDGWLERHARLRERLAPLPGYGTSLHLGAAIHSARAVPRAALQAFGELDGPLHIHLSEQPAENEQIRAAYGMSPTELLAEAGLLGPRLSAVHATHLSQGDITLLGESGSHIVMCPTTEADLADGIGPARALADAGAVISLGSDQHAVLDPLLEARGLEHGERLATGRRGSFSPAELLHALTTGGASSLGLGAAGIAAGGTADLLSLDPASMRTIGSTPEQLLLSATAADAAAVVVAGELVARGGAHERLGSVAELYREAGLAG